MSQERRRDPLYSRTMDGTQPITDSQLGWRPAGAGRVALVLQGGGALGAYQVGVYEALHEEGMEPDWVCGVSIGAINSAIIAGNPREHRLEKLLIFWDRITARKVCTTRRMATSIGRRATLRVLS